MEGVGVIDPKSNGVGRKRGMRIKMISSASDVLSEVEHRIPNRALSS